MVASDRTCLLPYTVVSLRLQLGQWSDEINQNVICMQSRYEHMSIKKLASLNGNSTNMHIDWWISYRKFKMAGSSLLAPCRINFTHVLSLGAKDTIDGVGDTSAAVPHHQC